MRVVRAVLLLLGLGAALRVPSQLAPRLSRAAAAPCSRAAAPRAVAPPPELTGGQRRQLRSHAGRLAAAKTLAYAQVADVPKAVGTVSDALDAHELVRCKFLTAEKKAQAKLLAAELAAATGAAVAEVLGHTALLYRPTAARLIELE